MGVYLGRHQKGGKDGCGAHMARRVKKRGNENEFANNFHTPTRKSAMSFAPPPTDVPGKGGEPPAATNAEQLLPPPPPPPSDGGAAAVVMTATSAREVAAGRGIYRLDGWALRAQAGHAADELPFEDPFEGFKVL